MEFRENKVTKIRFARGEEIACQHVIVATGAWAGDIEAMLDISSPVVPQRGQILSLKQPVPPLPSLRHIVFGEAIYLAPKNDGTIVVGATKEDVGFEKQLTAGGVAWLLTTALRLLPGLAEASIEQMWSGLRPKTPDNLPILGKAPNWRNVTLAVGHGSIGIALSAITGRSIAEVVTTGNVPAILVPFSVERFS